MYLYVIGGNPVIDYIVCIELLNQAHLYFAIKNWQNIKFEIDQGQNWLFRAVEVPWLPYLSRETLTARRDTAEFDQNIGF